MRAYVLIESAVGRASDIAKGVKKVKLKDANVVSVDAVTGPYDIIAIVEAPDLNAVGDLVTSQIHTINGIVRTVTCLSVGSV